VSASGVPLRRQRAGFELGFERLAFDEIHRDVARAVVLVETVNRTDVSVVQRGEELGFALEACEPIGVLRERARQRLDRNLTAELRISGAVNLAHPAGTERADDEVRAELSPRGQCHGRRSTQRRPGRGQGALNGLSILVGVAHHWDCGQAAGRSRHRIGLAPRGGAEFHDLRRADGTSGQPRAPPRVARS
jgi:hypothetical protein